MLSWRVFWIKQRGNGNMTKLEIASETIAGITVIITVGAVLFYGVLL
jgi:hypothetical protein